MIKIISKEEFEKNKEKKLQVLSKMKKVKKFTEMKGIDKRGLDIVLSLSKINLKLNEEGFSIVMIQKDDETLPEILIKDNNDGNKSEFYDLSCMLMISDLMVKESIEDINKL